MKAFESLLDGCGLNESGAHNSQAPLPSGLISGMTLPDIGLVSAGITIPQGSVAIETPMEGFVMAPSSGMGSVSTNGGNLLDSPFENPLTPRS